jgi:hypothetical protein
MSLSYNDYLIKNINILNLSNLVSLNYNKKYATFQISFKQAENFIKVYTGAPLLEVSLLLFLYINLLSLPQIKNFIKGDSSDIFLVFSLNKKRVSRFLYFLVQHAFCFFLLVTLKKAYKFDGNMLPGYLDQVPQIFNAPIIKKVPFNLYF